jgi:hypothetical protein
MMQLLEHIETQAGLAVPPEDVTLENLDSIERILAYLKRRSGG